MKRPTSTARRLARLRATLRRLHRDENGATTLEYALLIAVIAIPSATIVFLLLDVLVAYYEMHATLNALPFP
mgnify:FL=1